MPTVYYERFNGRVDNNIRLRHDFFDNGILYDPYKIDKIEIWKTRYDPEFENEYPGTLLKDVIYGSRIILTDVGNNAYGTLGFTAGYAPSTLVAVTEYTQEFTNQTNISFSHNLNDRYPVVTVYDNLNTIVVPDVVTSVDANTINVQFSSPMSGTVDILGSTTIGVLPAISLVRKFITSFVNETTVTVKHDLNDNFPSVVVYDLNYNVLYPNEVQIVDADTIQLTFITPQSGTVVVTGGNVGFATVGFGCQATVDGTISQATCPCQIFDIHTGENDKLLISVDGGPDQTITLPQNYRASTDDIVSYINSVAIGFAALNNNGYIQLISNNYGLSASLNLKTIANSAYTTLGLPQGLTTGFGYPPASTIGSKNGTFTITPTSKWISIIIDGGSTENIDLLQGGLTTQKLTGDQICAIIRQYIGTGIASMTPARAVMISATSTIDIMPIANDCYAELGFTVGNYGTTYVGTGMEYFTFTTLNNMLRIVNNYQPSVDVVLPPGDLTAAQVAVLINATFTANNILAASDVTIGMQGGRVKIYSLVNDNIVRYGVGQYYTDFGIPQSYVANGVVELQYFDVWYYAPNQIWLNDIADDSTQFTVYADNFFIDDGFPQYDYAFTLLKDTFWKGEKRVLITKVTPLPKYKTPIVNQWILPISPSFVQITTDEGSMIQPWGPTNVNSGNEIRVNLDTTQPTWREGLYKMQLKIELPIDETILSPWLKFRITNK